MNGLIICVIGGALLGVALDNAAAGALIGAGVWAIARTFDFHKEECDCGHKDTEDMS